MIEVVNELRSERAVALLALSVALGCGSSTPAPTGANAPAAAPAPAAVSTPVPETPPAAAASAELPAECPQDGARDRDLIAVTCSAACTTFRVVPRRCERGKWQKLAPIEPACGCAPESVPPSLRECKARTITLTPMDDGTIDSVSLTLTCGKTLLDVFCDGENDGTGTSLCTCQREGEEVRLPGNPWPGMGISLAYRVAERCLATHR